MELGSTETLDKLAGFTVSVAVVVFPPRLAVIVTVFAAVTPKVLIVNVALLAPEAIVTLAGTVAADGIELVKVTTAPNGPA